MFITDLTQYVRRYNQIFLAWLQNPCTEVSIRALALDVGRIQFAKSYSINFKSLEETHDEAQCYVHAPHPGNEEFGKT
jgi:hypothetical protein